MYANVNDSKPFNHLEELSEVATYPSLSTDDLWDEWVMLDMQMNADHVAYSAAYETVDEERQEVGIPTVWGIMQAAVNTELEFREAGDGSGSLSEAAAERGAQLHARAVGEFESTMRYLSDLPPLALRNNLNVGARVRIGSGWVTVIDVVRQTPAGSQIVGLSYVGRADRGDSWVFDPSEVREIGIEDEVAHGA